MGTDGAAARASRPRSRSRRRSCRHFPDAARSRRVRRPLRLGRAWTSRTSPTSCCAGPSKARGRRTAPKAGGRCGRPDDAALSADAAAHTGTQRTAGARRIAEAFARARAEVVPPSSPTSSPGYPDADTSLEIALRGDRCRRRHARGGAPVLGPAGGRRHAPARVAAALAAGATFERSLALLGRIARARPDPARPDGLRQPARGRGRRPGAVRARLASAGAAGVIVADLTPDEGGPFEAAAAERGSPSSTSSPRRRPPSAGPGSRRGAAGSCTASRSSA